MGIYHFYKFLFIKYVCNAHIIFSECRCFGCVLKRCVPISWARAVIEGTRPSLVRSGYTARRVRSISSIVPPTEDEITVIWSDNDVPTTLTKTMKRRRTRWTLASLIKKIKRISSTTKRHPTTTRGDSKSEICGCRCYAIVP